MKTQNNEPRYTIESIAKGAGTVFIIFVTLAALGAVKFGMREVINPDWNDVEGCKTVEVEDGPHTLPSGVQYWIINEKVICE